jgi:hypothetical protein
VDLDGTVHDFNLGAHIPALTDEDAELIHTLWLKATSEGGLEDLHHKEVVTVALARLAGDLEGVRRRETMEQMRSLLGSRLRDRSAST